MFGEVGVVRDEVGERVGRTVGDPTVPASAAAAGLPVVPVVAELSVLPVVSADAVAPDAAVAGAVVPDDAAGTVLSIGAGHPGAE